MLVGLVIMCFSFKYKDFQPLTEFNTTQMDENKLFFPLIRIILK